MNIVRSEGIGSLLRLRYLVEARERLERGELSAADFKRDEDLAVDEAVEHRRPPASTSSPTGGQRRHAFFGHLIQALEGFDELGGWSIPSATSGAISSSRDTTAPGCRPSATSTCMTRGSRVAFPNAASTSRAAGRTRRAATAKSPSRARSMDIHEA